jgi:archaellum biogenesis ATPase FlaH
MLSNNLQDYILRGFFTNEKYMRKVVPFMEANYFEGVHKELFKLFVKYVAKYNGSPSAQSFAVIIEEEQDKFSEDGYRHAMDILPQLFTPIDSQEEFLLDQTEKWCQDRAVYNAIMESISIIDGKHKTLTKNALPDILTKALSVTFDTNIGHDYLENVEQRYEFYHEKEDRIPFDLEYFNEITKGGLPNKSLNIVLAGTGVGKSLIMCHMAGNALSQGKNVLYITMEMAEERIAERIDANLLNLPMDQVETLSKDMFKDKVSKIATKTNGKLIIKEYPTGQAHAGHFRALLNELKLKKKFVPDILFIDYLNICASSRMKGMGGSINSYTYIKAIAEEIRGLAVEFNLPIMSATQTTRAGYASSDPGLEDTSESFGLPATADLMFAAISNDELASLNQLMIKQLKNRYNDPNMNKRFVVGVDRSKMKLYDVVQDEKKMEVVDEGPVFDKTTAGSKINSEGFVI